MALNKVNGLMVDIANASITSDKLDPTLDSTLVKTTAIGVSVQAFDADTAKVDVAQNFTAPQRAALQVDDGGIFDLGLKQNFYCTPSGAVTLQFQNQLDGLSGWVYFDNTAGVVVGAHTNTKITTTDLVKLNVAGVYRIDFGSNGTNALCSVVGPY